MNSHGTAPDRAPAPRLVEIAENVFAYVQPYGGWCVSNAGVIAGKRALTVVDTAATESRARALRAAVDGLPAAPARFLVNTHHHGDHTFGNFVFEGDFTIIAHERARTEMADKGLGLKQVWPETDWGDITLRLPDVTFSDRFTLYLGELTLELFHVGSAHSTNDIVAWVPEARVLFAGDLLFSGGTPFCFMGSLEGSLRALNSLRELGAETVVCGHGPLCGPEVIDTTEQYLLWVRNLAAAGLAAGVEPLELALQTDLGPYARLLDSERLVANLHRAYSEQRGVPPGAHLSSGPVIDEMIAFNGGRPLLSLA